MSKKKSKKSKGEVISKDLGLKNVTSSKSFRIVEYIRSGPKVGPNKKPKNKVGILFAVKSENHEKPEIYWSLCRKGDKFDFAEGVTQAVTRNEVLIPQTVQRALPKFLDRCRRYFKTEEFVVH